MTIEFKPSGFVGLPSAIWHVANWRDAALWEIERDHRETEYWVYLLRHDDAAFLPDRMHWKFHQDGDPIPPGTFERMSSYADAERAVRSALYAGTLTAYFISDAPASAGQLLHILPQGWATEAGQEILWYGRASLHDEPTPRLVLIDAYQVTQLFKPEKALPATAQTEKTVGPGTAIAPKKGGRPAGYQWEKVERFAMGLLYHYGPPGPDEPELASQAAFERKISEYISKTHDGREPATSTVRERASAWLNAYRQEQESKQADNLGRK